MPVLASNVLIPIMQTCNMTIQEIALKFVEKPVITAMFSVMIKLCQIQTETDAIQIAKLRMDISAIKALTQGQIFAKEKSLRFYTSM